MALAMPWRRGRRSGPPPERAEPLRRARDLEGAGALRAWGEAPVSHAPHTAEHLDLEGAGALRDWGEAPDLYSSASSAHPPAERAGASLAWERQGNSSLYLT
jgi:hypothetical protein